MFLFLLITVGIEPIEHMMYIGIAAGVVLVLVVVVLVLVVVAIWSLCQRSKAKVASKYIVNELQVPSQCDTIWSALQRAAASAGKIKIIRIERGTFIMTKGFVCINFSNIHIIGAGKDVTFIVREDNLAKLQIEGAENVRIEGISIGGEGSGDALVIINQSKVLLENCEIKGVGGFGVYVSGGSNCELVGCNIEQTFCPGVWVDGGTDSARATTTCILQNSNIHSTNAEGIAALNFARVDIQGSCDIHHNRLAGIYAGSGGSITLCSKEIKCYKNMMDEEKIDVEADTCDILTEDNGIVKRYTS